MRWKRTVGRSARGVAIGLGIPLAAAALVLGALSYRDIQRIDRVEQRIEHAVRLRRVTARLLVMLIDRQAGTPADTATLDELAREIETLSTYGDAENAPGDSSLAHLQDLLRHDAPLTEARLVEGLRLTRDVTGADLRAQERLLEQTRWDLRLELELAVAILCGLTMMSLVGWWVVRKRFFRPLEDLRSLFTLLADGDFKAVGVGDIEPMLIPLFNNYNYLVTRLQTLEEEHRMRATSLEGEVRGATQTLLEQHRSLANAERLAVVGEMAAGVAHELRNPLAGVSMILTNLRRDVSDPRLVERLDVAVKEIQRTTRLLEEYLAIGQHAPEPSQTVAVAGLVADLLGLLRYQVQEHITLQSDVTEDIECTVPRDRLRQVLLNLVLNSVQALGDTTGTVTIAAAVVGDRVALSVRDDGPGFPPGAATALTRAFVTQHGTGTGLGLVVVRRFVQDLGGELELTNVEPHGACITLTLPCTHG